MVLKYFFLCFGMGDSLDFVVAAYIVDKDKLLLIHHKKRDKWIPAGGHIGKNEIPDDALKRGVMEEIGIDISFINHNYPRQNNQLACAIPFDADKLAISENHVHYCQFYLCKPKSLDIKINPEKVLDYGWFNFKELKSLTPQLNHEELTSYGLTICLEKVINNRPSNISSFLPPQISQ